MTAKTNAERWRDLKDRREAQGLKELRGIWCTEAEATELRKLAAKLQRKREKEKR